MKIVGETSEVVGRGRERPGNLTLEVVGVEILATWGRGTVEVWVGALLFLEIKKRGELFVFFPLKIINTHCFFFCFYLSAHWPAGRMQREIYLGPTLIRFSQPFFGVLTTPLHCSSNMGVSTP